MTPYLGGSNSFQIPQGSGTNRANFGYYSIPLQDAARTVPTVIATRSLSGQLHNLPGT